MNSKRRFIYAYPRPALTADVLLFAMRDKQLSLLLIQRKSDPFKGAWALPGGFVDEHESPQAAALRELREETGIPKLRLVELGAYGDPGRDPRGWTVSIAFMAKVQARRVKPKAGSDASAVAWHPVKNLPKLAFDHKEIIADGVQRLPGLHRRR